MFNIYKIYEKYNEHKSYSIYEGTTSIHHIYHIIFEAAVKISYFPSEGKKIPEFYKSIVLKENIIKVFFSVSERISKTISIQNITT